MNPDERNAYWTASKALDAARYERDSCARFLADRVLDGTHDDITIQMYRERVAAYDIAAAAYDIAAAAYDIAAAPIRARIAS